jgi:multimeric flavodoxin WrbA
MILEKMLRADGIIIASPNYINQVTGSMKALFDRSSHFIHCKLLMGKYVAGVVSSGSGQDKPVLDYIKYYGHVCGAQYTGGVSASAPVSEEKLAEGSGLGKALRLDIEKKRRYRDQLKIIEQGRQHFKNIMEKRKEDWVEEYEYWQRMGWL